MDCCNNALNLGCFDSCETCLTIPDFGVFALDTRFKTVFTINNNKFIQENGVNGDGFYTIDISNLPMYYDIVFTVYNITDDEDVHLEGIMDIYGHQYTFEYTCFTFTINATTRTLTNACDIIETECETLACDAPEHILLLNNQIVNIQRVRNVEDKTGYELVDFDIEVGSCISAIKLKRYMLFDDVSNSYQVPIVFMTATEIFNPTPIETQVVQIGPFLYNEFASPLPVNLYLYIVYEAIDENCGKVEYQMEIDIVLLP